MRHRMALRDSERKSQAKFERRDTHLKQKALHVVPLQKICRRAACNPTPNHRNFRPVISSCEVRLCSSRAGQTGLQSCLTHRAAAAHFAEAANIKPKVC